MLSQAVDSPDYVPSGFMHPDKRRAGGLGRAGDSKRNTTEAAEAIGRVFVERARSIAEAVPVLRDAKHSKPHSHKKPPKKHPSKAAYQGVGPTEARLAKGDVLIVGGVHRSEPPIEKLCRSEDLDDDAKTNLAMRLAAEKLQKHYNCSVNGVRATDSIDIDAAMAPGGFSDLTGEEGWVYHYDEFRKACVLMGYWPDRPHHGSARIVVAVACLEMSVRAAAEANLPSLRTDRMQAIGMDRLRSGLLQLAHLWSFL